MATWVVILTYYTKGIAVIPGYATEAECRLAATNADAIGGIYGACIPGPTK